MCICIDGKPKKTKRGIIVWRVFKLYANHDDGFQLSAPYRFDQYKVGKPKHRKGAQQRFPEHGIHSYASRRMASVEAKAPYWDSRASITVVLQCRAFGIVTPGIVSANTGNARGYVSTDLVVIDNAFNKKAIAEGVARCKKQGI